MTEIKIPIIAGLSYKHKRTGNYYEVIAIANLFVEGEKKEEYPVTIVYERLYDGTVWSRTLDNFLENFEIES